MSPEMQWFLKRTLLCLFILWILGVLTGFIFTFLPRNEESGAASIGFTDEATSTIVNLNYDTDVTNNGSLVVTNLPGLAEQIAKTYSVSRNMVRVFSARFIQSLILTRKKRQSASVANNTNIRTKLQLVIETQFIYPRSCGGVKICNDRFINSIRNTIERIDSEVPFTVSLTNGIILNIDIVFQSFDRTTSTTTTTTTTTTTIDTTSTSATTSTTATTTSTTTTITESKITTATTSTTSIITTTTTTVPPGWALASNLRVIRFTHADVLLPDGNVLLIGGNHLSDYLRNVELYDPKTNLWKDMTAMASKRRLLRACLLKNGRVLAIGGLSSSGVYLATTELLNLTSNSWSYSGTMNSQRGIHTASLLADGYVLVAGGRTFSGPLNTAELYDPTTGNWTLTKTLNRPHSGHIESILSNGKILIAGGLSTGDICTNTAELYDRTTGNWTMTNSMNYARDQATASALADGKVLVAGGRGTLNALNTAEVYDPTTGNWTMVSNMTFARYAHRASILKNGKVFITGGINENGDTLNTAELYDPTTDIWTTIENMSFSRYWHSSTLLDNGRVLIAGGTDGTVALNSVEIYT